MRNIRYLLEVIAAGIFWGITSIFLKNLNSQNLHPLQVVFIRGIIGSSIMFIFLLAKDKSLLKIHLKDIWMFIGTGVISLTFFSMCYYRCILDVGASVAVILLYTAPIFVLILSFIIFREKITGRKLVALVLTFTGCILVSGMGSQNYRIAPLNFIIGLGSGLGYALYSIFSRFALKKYNPLTITIYTFLFSAISIAPFCNVSDLASKMAVSIIPSCLGIVILCTVLPYICYTHGMTGLDTGKAAIFVTVEPLVGTLVGILIFSEPANLAKILGIALIFVSVIILGLKKNKS